MGILVQHNYNRDDLLASLDKNRTMKHLLLLVWALHLSLTAPQECEEKDIRITNESVTTIGNSYSVAGGLQMCVNNQWATVCRSGWSDIDATVACGQLGLNYTGRLIFPIVTYFIPKSGYCSLLTATNNHAYGKGQL